MKQKKIGYIGWAMRYHNIVFIRYLWSLCFV